MSHVAAADIAERMNRCVKHLGNSFKVISKPFDSCHCPMSNAMYFKNMLPSTHAFVFANPICVKGWIGADCGCDDDGMEWNRLALVYSIPLSSQPQSAPILL